ncbi:MAG: hypothetical protein ACE5FH_06800, partial [Candidatus Zixiibacteriota bacterium]
MCRNKIIAAAVCCLAVFYIGSSAVAFEYAGEAWCCDTVYYYVNTTNPSSACGNTITGSWFKGLINSAASQWNGLNTVFQLAYVDSTLIGCEANAAWPGFCVGIKDGQNTISMA